MTLKLEYSYGNITLTNSHVQADKIMLLPGKQRWIRHKAVQNRTDYSGKWILWSRHATAKLVNLSLSRTEVEQALEQCEVIEDYAALHRSLPDCLVLGFLSSGQAVHVVAAIDEESERLFIVTVYRYCLCTIYG